MVPFVAGETLPAVQYFDQQGKTPRDGAVVNAPAKVREIGGYVITVPRIADMPVRMKAVRS